MTNNPQLPPTPNTVSHDDDQRKTALAALGHHHIQKLPLKSVNPEKVVHVPRSRWGGKDD